MSETFELPREVRENNLSVFILSGYFTFLHHGHLDMIDDAAERADRLLVIVNSDEQQELKKGELILDESLRLRQLGALAAVDYVYLSVDTDRGQAQTLEAIFEDNPGIEFTFGNGGDKNSVDDILAEQKGNREFEVCQQYGVPMVYGVGGTTKRDSTSDIVERIRNTT